MILHCRASEDRSEKEAESSFWFLLALVWAVIWIKNVRIHRGRFIGFLVLGLLFLSPLVWFIRPRASLSILGIVLLIFISAYLGC